MIVIKKNYLLLTPRPEEGGGQSDNRRYLYHQGNVQTTGGILRAAAGPWLIPAGK